jgi:hypothetical protein
MNHFGGDSSVGFLALGIGGSLRRLGG